MAWLVPTKIPLPEEFRGFDPQSGTPLPDFQSYERHLPHWRLPGACYISTFRLDDSLPIEVVREMRQEKNEWKRRLARAAASHDGRLPAEDQAAWEHFQRVQLLKLESLLDEGHGECLLRDAHCRDVVAAALHHFEGERCEMLAFVIMPNHVHGLCRPLAGRDPENLAGSWKRHSSRKINQMSGKRGALWQQETFDRIIRDAEHFRQAVRYIAKNPVQAKLHMSEASVWFCDAVCLASGWEPMGKR